MSVEPDSSPFPSDPQPVVETLPPAQRVSPADAPAANLALPQAARMLEEGLCRLVARGLPDDEFWEAFAGLYHRLAGDLAGTDRTRLAFHADYALARMGLPVWTVMEQSLKEAVVASPSAGPDGPVAAAA
ncbi:hypothetical protein QFW77_13080 [Luteimonas sp. RD2P54]|uniref:Uncharacterized protein n=1 Tax=Luteimonas endophytica TaxID=3042023 RepID=A0ABT6JAS9_9GAMM|nr:hypothetical protein [Luteimonas endophytica]MDH5823911.1 hypothetical protein [Luteimonas endophytica]